MKTKLQELGVCKDGQEWADSQESYRKAWEICDRGDWMLWIAKKQDVDLRVLTKAKVECAKLVEHLMVDEGSINALRVAERFADGNASHQELHDATYAAAYAASLASLDVVAAAYAAAYAAFYASAEAAASAASLAADADDGDDYKKRREILSICADICRKYINFDDLNMEQS